MSLPRTALFSRKAPGGVFVIEDEGKSTGARVFVHSGTGTDAAGYGDNPDRPVATLDYAIGLCEANKGDIIYVMPGHSETWTTTGTKVTGDIAGVKIIGLGEGADRPTFTFEHTGATWAISANGVKIDNILFATNVDQVVTFMTVSGDDVEIGLKDGKGVEIRDTTDKEVVDAITVSNGVSRFGARVLHRGYTGGDANQRTFKLDGVAGADIFVVALGKAQTAVVNFVSHACSDILVTGIFLVTSTTNLSKDVVDTVTGSTWQCQGFDLAAGCSFSGGSGAALAKDDVSTIITAIGTLVNTGGTATLGGILGDVANVSIATSLAKLGTLVNTGGLATLGAILGDLNNVTVATWLAKIGTLVNTGGTATLGGILGDVANVSIATSLAKLGTITNTGGTATIGAILGDLANVTVATWLAKIGTLVNTGGTATLGGILGDVANVSVATRLASALQATGIGTLFSVSKTINQNTIVAAGAALTGVSSVGALEIEDVIVQVATAVDSGGHAAVVELYTDNVLGNSSFMTMAQAKLPANGGCDFKNATTARKLTLETGKKISVKATTEDVTSNADITFTIIFRRLVAGATIAAA